MAEDEGFDKMNVLPPSRPAASNTPPGVLHLDGLESLSPARKNVDTLPHTPATKMTLCLHPYGRIHKVMDSPTV